MTTPAPVTELIAVTIDSPDAAALAQFYGSLTGGEVTTYPEYGVASVVFGAHTLYFQTVAEFSAPHWPSQQHPQQFHLDFRTGDLAAAVDRAQALGASIAAAQPNPTMSTVMLDPDGHPFCLCPPQEA